VEGMLAPIIGKEGPDRSGQGKAVSGELGKVRNGWEGAGGALVCERR